MRGLSRVVGYNSYATMKKVVVIFLILFVLGMATLYFLSLRRGFVSPLGTIIPKKYPLLDYTYDNLRKTKYPESQIVLGRVIAETTESLEQTFYYSVPGKPNGSSHLIVSGVINTPKLPGTYPIIVMFRGYMPKESYQPGDETEPSAKIFAKNGFITLAPDFLGYGESASPSADAFEERFQTYTTALALLSSLPNLSKGFEASFSGTIKADLTKIGIWGHSNGGQIALSTLEISGLPYPTVLWAPVSKSFPYSILYYTDEADDQGKMLRKVLANFEKDYDTELFSLTNYLGWIKAPLEIHKGEADKEVPVWWSDELVKELKSYDLDVKYFTYPGADHNMLPDAWSAAVTRSVDFYKNNFSK